MDLKISDSWLRDYLETKATPEKLAECLSLCGPSIEKIKKVDGDSVYGADAIYDIEVTTNRIDSASVYGIAREANAILPRFKIDAKLKKIKTDNNSYTFTKTVPYLSAVVDPSLCSRFTAVLIKNVVTDHSPEWMVKRLEASGVRAINNVVDISNYIMFGLGQPVHTFDYDKIAGAKMILRESKKGEKITTLDGKVFTLPGGDIVIEDGDGRLIDLAGVMGGALSMVDENTKNVLLFVQTYDPLRIRKTSMSLAQRTQAATIFEKGLDSELVAPAVLQGIEMFKDLCHGTPEKQILNIYSKPCKSSKISVDIKDIELVLGIKIEKAVISKILNSLEFETAWKGSVLEVIPPSYRAKDILIAEDVVEEIARIYGYHNLPSKLMTGEIPDYPQSSNFSFEENIKNILSGLGGNEVYTLSLTPAGPAGEKALKLKNPLGAETEYLRTSLLPSLTSAANDNLGKEEEFHIFEMSNVYLPRANDLPEELLTLAGILVGYDYRLAKGVVEAFLEKLNIDASFIGQDMMGFSASRAVQIKAKGIDIGVMGLTDENFVYYEFEVEKLKFATQQHRYSEIPKYPSQVEDITFVLPEKTRLGEVAKLIESNKSVIECSLESIYENTSVTFNVVYQDPNKTLTNENVEKIRKEIVSSVKSKFGGTIKG